jgi:hypothetical protein
MFYIAYDEKRNESFKIEKCNYKSKAEMHHWIYESKHAPVEDIIANMEKVHINIFCEKNADAYKVLNKMPKLINFRSLEKNVNSHLVYKHHKSRITWFAIKHNPKVLNEIETDISKIRW